MLHWHDGLVNILFKQVGMCAGVDKEECQSLVVLSPAEQPVWPNMTFPLVFSIAHQFVGMIFRWQCSCVLQQIDGFFKQGNVKTSFDTNFHILNEAPGIDDFIHQPSICANISLALAA